MGKHRSLGNWDSRAGVQMAWGAGDIWTGYVALPAGHVYDYKYALVTPSSQMWEKGANRMLTVDIEDVEVGIEVIDRWEDASGSKLVTSSGVISSTGAKLAETLQKARKSVEDALAANRSLKAELAQKEVVNRVNQKEIKLALTRVSEAEKVAKDAKEQARQTEELAIERVEAAKEEARRELEDLAGTALKRAEDAETTSSDLSMKLTQAEQRALRAEEKEAELRETLMLKEKHMKEAGERIRSLEVEKEGLEMEMLDGAERFREALQATRALFMTEKKVIKKSVGEALQVPEVRQRRTKEVWGKSLRTCFPTARGGPSDKLKCICTCTCTYYSTGTAVHVLNLVLSSTFQALACKHVHVFVLYENLVPEGTCMCK